MLVKNLLLLDSSGAVAVSMLSNPECQGAIEYAHLVTDNPAATTQAYATGALNDHSSDVIDARVSRLADSYRTMRMEFPYVILTDTNPGDDDDQAIREWNELLAAAQPMLDLTDTLVICVTTREFNTRLLESPDKARLAATAEEAVRIFLG